MVSPKISLVQSIGMNHRLISTLILAIGLALSLTACSGSGANGGEEGPNAPAAPTGLSATSQDGAIGLDWEEVSGADTYRVYRSTSSGVSISSRPLDTGISSADYADESAENGATYYYVVTAIAKESGETAESDPSNEVEKTPFSDPPSRP